jgi:hypothetical protein
MRRFTLTQSKPTVIYKDGQIDRQPERIAEQDTSLSTMVKLLNRMTNAQRELTFRVIANDETVAEAAEGMGITAAQADKLIDEIDALRRNLDDEA